MTVNNLHPRVTEEDIVVSILPCQNLTSVSRIPKTTPRFPDSDRTQYSVISGLRFITGHKAISTEGKGSWAKARGH